MWSTFREHAGIPKEALKMSDQDRREKLPSNTEDTESGEDVDAHVKRFGNDEEGGEDVEAHVKRYGNDEGGDDDGGDDVEAHVKQAR
jgi:hypothetical protein